MKVNFNVTVYVYLGELNVHFAPETKGIPSNHLGSILQIEFILVMDNPLCSFGPTSFSNRIFILFNEIFF